MNTHLAVKGMVTFDMVIVTLLNAPWVSELEGVWSTTHTKWILVYITGELDDKWPGRLCWISDDDRSRCL